MSSTAYVCDRNIRIFVSEIFVVEDCHYFDTQTVDKNRYTVVTGSATISYSSDGVSITGTSTNGDTYVKNTALTLPNEYVATCEVKNLIAVNQGATKYFGGICFDDWFVDWNNVNNGSKTYKLSTVTALSQNLQNVAVNDVVKIVRESNTIKYYINDTLIATNSNITHTGEYQHRTYNTRGLTIKNLKIKPL